METTHNPRVPWLAITLTILMVLVVTQVTLYSVKMGLGLAALIAFIFLMRVGLQYAAIVLVVAIPVAWSYGQINIEVGPVNLRVTYLLVSAAIAFLLTTRIVVPLFRGRNNRPMTLDEKFYRPGPVDLPFALFLLVCLACVAISVDWHLSIKEFFQIGLYFLLYLFVANSLRSEKSVSQAAHAILVTTVVVSLTGVYTMGGSAISLSSGAPRMSGVFDDPNITANYILLGFPIAAAFVWGSHSWLKKSMYGLLMIATLIGIAASFSRAGWVVVLIAVPLVAILLGKARSGVAAVVTIAAVTAIVGGAAVKERVTDIVTLDQDSTVSHLYVWKAAGQIIGDHPVLGIGTGAFPRYYELYAGTSKMPSPRVMDSYVWEASARNYQMVAHNAFLQTWAETGTIGALALLSIIVVFIRTMLKAIRQSPEEDNAKMVLVGLFVGVLAVILHNLSITNLIDHFWAGLAVAMAAATVALDKSANSKRAA